MLSRCALVGIVLVSAAAARGDDGVEFFEKRIRPLLAEHCLKCHGEKAKGGLRLDSRAAALKGGESGAALVAGKPGESLVMRAVRYEKELRMPPKAKLSNEAIADLERWIAMGAPDPREGGVAPAKKSGIDLAAGKAFWSFQPVKATAPPVVKTPEWPANAVDRFILAKLESQHLKPAPAADRRTLLRRATYDLTGLPPTPEEVQAFVADPANDAFDKAIDRLLGSPAYGERWGRHWLDVVRYSDTAGDNSDFPIPQMYRYRNWVIAAFNADMPYDRFIQEQLAGDLLPAASPQGRSDQLVATGYLANSRRHGSHGEPKYPWHLTIEDTIDNFGKTFLGLTLACSRCHDHKFDPISTEDYYGLYGFFSSTRYPWPGIELDRYPNELVPLVDAPESMKLAKERDEKLVELGLELAKLEADKAPAAKIGAVRREREKVAGKPLPFELAYAIADGTSDRKRGIACAGDVRVQRKGEPERLGEIAPRRFPLALGGQTLPPSTPGSGRLELAKWIADPANPLTARVMVNRIWQHHFGEGLVATANNFGKQGRPPSDPALLDYLAQQFVDSGWSIKHMHRLIMRSRTYQMASADDADNAKIDPNNVSHWRFDCRRHDAESIRDTLLAVSGGLDRTPGGPHPFPPQSSWGFSQHNPFKAVYPTKRRSVYLMTQRIQRHPFLALFDGADTNASTASRETSTTPLQALFLMNDSFVHETAKTFAARLLSEAETDVGRIERAFLYAYGRPPTAGETQGASEFLRAVSERDAGSTESRRARAWESFARALFMSNEFVYVN